MAKRILADFDPERHVEMLLLNSLRHEITNFRPRFPLKQIDNTYFLSDAGSDWFSIEVAQDKVFLCVPFEIMKHFCFMDMVNISIINKGTPERPKYDNGLYLIFKVGDRTLRKFGALRIRCSGKRAELLAKSHEVHIIAINDDGEAYGIEEGKTYFKLYMKVEDAKSLHEAPWEK